MQMLKIVIYVIANLLLVKNVYGHGYVIDPPSRSSLWRLQVPNAPINYDDNGLNCGGFADQWDKHNGSCGICGDSYGQSQPRDNEAGGKYGNGIIGSTYKVGQEVDITIVVTANHHGWFEFRLCPNNNVKKIAPQSCLDRHLLELADGSGSRYHIPPDSSSSCTLQIKVKLPESVVCSQCVLQWHWNTASNWGICPSGEGKMGCGPQETFRGCADIAILVKDKRHEIY